MAEITVTELYKQNRIKLKLKWIAGLNGGHNTLNHKAVTKPTLALIGHVNYVFPNRVHVIGCAEMDFLRNLSPEEAKIAIQNLYKTKYRNLLSILRTLKMLHYLLQPCKVQI
jgi:HPr kinase/phosphorylase